MTRLFISACLIGCPVVNMLTCMQNSFKMCVRENNWYFYKVERNFTYLVFLTFLLGINRLCKVVISASGEFMEAFIAFIFNDCFSNEKNTPLAYLEAIYIFNPNFPLSLWVSSVV